MLTKLQSIKEERESGFTLIELLVVILIIGILSAIAIPAFLNQRKSAVDSSVQSDLKNAGTTIETWLAKGNKIDNYRAINGGQISNIVEGTNAVHNFPAGTTRWNDIAGVPKIAVSDGTTLEVIMLKTQSGYWDRAHEEGEFCLTAVNQGSNYNRIPYVSSDSMFDKVLYYDVKAGGVKTMAQLKTMRDAGQQISCSSHVQRYINATTP